MNWNDAYTAVLYNARYAVGVYGNELPTAVARLRSVYADWPVFALHVETLGALLARIDYARPIVIAVPGAMQREFAPLFRRLVTSGLGALLTTGTPYGAPLDHAGVRAAVERLLDAPVLAAA